MTMRLTNPRRTPAAIEADYQKFVGLVLAAAPCWNQDGTPVDNGGKLALIMPAVKTAFMYEENGNINSPQAVASFVSETLLGGTFAVVQVNGKASHDAGWAYINSSHGQLTNDVRAKFVTGGTATGGGGRQPAPTSEIAGGGNHELAVEGQTFVGVGGFQVHNLGHSQAEPDPLYIAEREKLFATHPYTPPVPPGTPQPDPDQPGGTLTPGHGIA